MVASLFFGTLCGLALGLTGGGGSILAVPLLVYGLKIPFHQAVTISLLVVGLTAVIGFFPKIKSGEVELSAGVTLAIAGMLFAPVGSYISSYFKGHSLMLAFSGLMIFIGIWSLVKAKFFVKKALKTGSCNYLPNGKLHLTIQCRAVLITVGIITGLLTGLFGVGGGFLIVPALVLATNMALKKAISTSLLIISLVSLVGFISHINHSQIEVAIALFFMVGSAVGVVLASQIKGLLNDKALQMIFSLVLIMLGIIILALQYLNSINKIF